MPSSPNELTVDRALPRLFGSRAVAIQDVGQNRIRLLGAVNPTQLIK